MPVEVERSDPFIPRSPFGILAPAVEVKVLFLGFQGLGFQRGRGSVSRATGNGVHVLKKWGDIEMTIKSELESKIKRFEELQEQFPDQFEYLNGCIDGLKIALDVICK